MSYPLLENAPAQDTKEFIEYLRDNNTVVKETLEWIIIENCKYHRSDRKWYTAFYKDYFDEENEVRPLLAMGEPLSFFPDFEWLKKSKERQTVPGRFHIHIYENYGD